MILLKKFLLLIPFLTLRYFSYAQTDTLRYDSLMKQLANGSTYWQAKKNVYPQAGAILPFDRVVAYYGNLYSKNMGILGQYPKPVVLAKLQDEVNRWQQADPATPVIPALHYIGVTAQASPGRDSLYNLRMPFSQIDSVLKMAESIKALVFLDIQIGRSVVQRELPLLEKYLRMPNVHFGIDPEFAMKESGVPGKRIGNFDASEINWVTGYLADLVIRYNLPPKIFVVHRFTRRMVTNYQNISLRPQIQFVMDMDGWGSPESKKKTYGAFITPEPVQFAGFKVFYKNDLKNAPKKLMTPAEILKLQPIPIYIQYQ